MTGGRSKQSIVATTLIILVVGGGFAYFNFYGGRAEVSVNCQPLVEGFDCLVEHLSGGADVEACWDISLSCANGTTSSAHACSLVESGGTAEVMVALSEFSSLDQCDQVASGEVTNLVIEDE